MCVEVCTNCTLPATGLAGATRVVAKNSCATATPANSWRMVPRLFTDSVWFVQFQNLGNGHCLTTDNSAAVPYCERGPCRGLHSSDRVLLGCGWRARGQSRDPRGPGWAVHLAPLSPRPAARRV